MINSITNAIKKVAGHVMRMAGCVTPQGNLKVSAVYKDGKRELLHEENLIVLGGKSRLLQVLYLGTAIEPITTLRVGNGGSIDPNGQFPRSPVESTEGLYNEVLQVTTTYVLGEDGKSITFLADVDASQLNGVLVNEAGLFFGDGAMFNIKTFPGIPKTEDFSIHFDWSIRIN